MSGIFIMLFNSFIFVFCFLPVSLAGFFLIAKRYRQEAAIGWLVVMSLIFYSWWNPLYFPLIAGLIGFNYILGVLLGKERSQRQRKAMLALGILVDLGCLGYFKYTNFVVSQLNDLAGFDIHIQKIALPLAISFFTFQKVAYLVDAYRNQTREYNFLHFSLFVSFFPQLIAGPIVHHKDILPQFAKKSVYRPNYKHLFIGLAVFAMGLFKKTIFADSIATTADDVFNSGDAVLGSFDAWAGALAYTLQLYFDFSGYSDMAIGAAYMFGITLPVNFDSPYKASGIIDFWRRWHITLSTFLRDYVYFSLGGSRKGNFRKYFNLFLTMLLGGIWHGAGWTFVIWGILHGSYLIINHAWRKIRNDILKMKDAGFPEKIAARALTLAAVIVAWVYFRAASPDDAHNVLRSMAGLQNQDSAASAIVQNQGVTMAAIIALSGIALFFPNTNQIKSRLEETDFSAIKNPAIAYLVPVIIAGLLVASVSTFMSVSKFLYFNF